jgi:hypothetical protein
MDHPKEDYTQVTDHLLEANNMDIIIITTTTSTMDMARDLEAEAVVLIRMVVIKDT